MPSWLLPLAIEVLAEDVIAATASIDPGWPWFQGHFPGNPVLPGVALLALAQAVLQQGTGREDLAFTGLRKVRFKGLVRPGDTLRFHLRREPALELGGEEFRVQLQAHSGRQEILVGQLLVRSRRPVPDSSLDSPLA